MRARVFDSTGHKTTATRTWCFGSVWCWRTTRPLDVQANVHARIHFATHRRLPCLASSCTHLSACFVERMAFRVMLALAGAALLAVAPAAADAATRKCNHLLVQHRAHTHAGQLARGDMDCDGARGARVVGAWLLHGQVAWALPHALAALVLSGSTRSPARESACGGNPYPGPATPRPTPAGRVGSSKKVGLRVRLDFFWCDSTNLPPKRKTAGLVTRPAGVGLGVAGPG